MAVTEGSGDPRASDLSGGADLGSTQPAQTADTQSSPPGRSSIPLGASNKRRDRPQMRRDPLRVYATRAVIWDTVAVALAATIGFILRWTIPYSVDISDGTYVFFALVVVVSWIVVLILRGAYDTRILGVGSEEFKRIIGASAMVFGAIAIVAFALKLEFSEALTSAITPMPVTCTELSEVLIRPAADE